MNTTDERLPQAPAEMQSTLVELRQRAGLLTLPGLVVIGLALAISANSFQDPLQPALFGTLLILLAALVWACRQAHEALSVRVLAIGVPALTFLGVTALRLDVLIYVLPAAIGISALALNPAESAAIAGLSTWLMVGVTSTEPNALLVQLVLVVGIWSTVALVWLAKHSLGTTVAWAWSSHLRSQHLLERARGYQVQAKEALADLAEANIQLTRLNQLADNARRAADEARSAKERFVANVSHELRTPLNMIIGFSEMIVQAPETYGDLPSSLLADLSVILRNSQHLSDLIDDVLDLSQIEADRMSLTKERVRPEGIIEAASAAVRPLFESKNLSFVVDVPGDLPTMLCDQTRIREVLLNLLSNAARFTDSGGVVLRVRRDNHDVEVRVTDTGPGIAPEDLGKIFQPFQQLEGSIRRRQGGSGLGLSISRSFVELHGGQMWCESERGVGTTFSFRLPIDGPTPLTEGASRWFGPYFHYEERSRRPAMTAPVVHPRIVLLEPGQSFQRLSRYLDGVEVLPVASLSEAKEELSRAPAQALLMNVRSPRAALADLDDMRGLPHGTPVVICSVPGTGEAAENLGVAEYLLKPVSREMLLEAIGRLPSSVRTILVVDDETEALTLFWRMLSSSERGYRVLTASDGREALEILRQDRPDAILMDLVMPNMDGFRLLEAMEQHPEWRQIPVLIVSARDPMGQPIASGVVAVVWPGGLSAAGLLSFVQRVIQTGALGTRPDSRERPETATG